MKNRFLIMFLLLSLGSFSQELTCLDFKNGTFYVPADNEIPIDFKIIREGNKQIEIVQDPENKLGEDFDKTS
ncbi:hypothetical protein Aeqsu_0583 [Aequorivita sublithincola DSM 14238]|uniref:Uncharacterized protein n=1 Tax=Aequorivita sublithincola (strain DSM 14238 / LMG 21431 / ACAM 643 / 9-3) TaxID=746697 RepID=I3YSX5_AEQSU|nr:hypothetical protein [Aequorivita sublithincola]AFL80093.1 hypothetical protein Aeqsu_0583 [Aequorivita sublithincola DSM 14238]